MSISLIACRGTLKRWGKVSGGGLVFQISSACSKYMFYFYKFDFESWLLLEIFIVKDTLIVDTYLHGARVEDFELHLGQAAIIRVSRAIEQTFFIFIMCTCCLVQIILNINLSKKVRRYLKSGKHCEKFLSRSLFFIEHFLQLIVPNFVRIS